MAALYQELPQARRVVAISWPGKTAVTFADVLTSVRRWIWSDGVFSRVRGGPAIAELPASLLEVLYSALAPAAKGPRNCTGRVGVEKIRRLVDLLG